MKIVFLCGSLEPGKDGVGDYTKRLASKFFVKGHEVAIIALNDKHISSKIIGSQYFDDVNLSIKRIPSLWSNKVRSEHVKEWIDGFNPDLISFQFVAFSYHSKGLPFNLINTLKGLLKGRKWHLMLHELWTGEFPDDSLKIKILGLFQKQIIKTLISHLAPQSVTTSNDFYQASLSKVQIIANKIPVFSNLPVGNKLGKILYNQLPLDVITNRKEYVIASFFGTIEISNDLEHKFRVLNKLSKNINKKLLVTHVGRASGIASYFMYLSSIMEFKTYVLGECQDQDIADFFRQIDIGLSTYPKVLFEKSGSIAAMLNNKLSVILLRDSVIPDTRKFPWIKEISEIEHLEEIINQVDNFHELYGIDKAADLYLQSFGSPELCRL